MVTDLARPSRLPAAVLAGRAGVATVLLATAAWAVLAARGGDSALLPGALFALATGLVVGGAWWLRLAPAPPGDLSFGPSYYLPLIVLRSSAWFLLAGEALVHPLPVPAWGDLPTGLQAVAVVAASLAFSPVRSRTRTLRMAFDGHVTAFAALIALWVVALGGPEGYRVDRPGVLVGLLVCYLVLLEISTIGFVLVRDHVRRSGSGFATVLLIGAAEIRLLASGLGDRPRGTDLVTVLLWLAGWVAFMVSATRRTERVPEVQLSHEIRDRSETVATGLATASVFGSVFVVLLGYPGGLYRIPGGLPGAVVALVVATVFAAREVFLSWVRVRLMESLRTQATLDPLTGLANRRGLTRAMAQVAAGHRDWVVLALDLDGFKAVNDLHGHAVGDEVLVTAAGVLRELCPRGGVAARTGGDEFALLTRGGVQDGRQLGGRIRATVEERLGRLALAPRITVSVGVGRLAAQSDPEHPVTTSDRLVVLVEAAAALRAAKAGGGNRVEVYPGRVARERERRLVVESRLREALAAGRITTVGQPVVDLRSGEAVAYEALARWQDEVLGVVPPEEFVAVAEETGLVAELGRQVLRSAVEGFAAAGLVGTGVRLAVNVSPVELRLPYHADAVAAILQGAGFPPWDLVVEVTEAVVIRAGDPAVRALAELSDLGVQVAIDDFGTGYSALGYLRRLPVQVLKVDRSLLAEALVSERTRQILAGVVDLSRRVALPVVVEGIEDEAGEQLARELGADRGQGYWLGVPAAWTEAAPRPSASSPAAGPARRAPGPARRRPRPVTGRAGSVPGVRAPG